AQNLGDDNVFGPPDRVDFAPLVDEGTDDGIGVKPQPAGAPLGRPAEHVVAAVDAHGCVGRHRARVVDRAIDEGTVFIADPLGIAARGVDGEPARGLVPGVDNDGDELIFQHNVVAGLALYRL